MSIEFPFAPDFFSPAEHALVAREVLMPDLYADGEGVDMLAEGEAELNLVGGNLMDRIIQCLGGKEKLSDPHSDERAFYIGALLALAVCDCLAGLRLDDIAGYRQAWLGDSAVFDNNIGSGGSFDAGQVVTTVSQLPMDDAYSEAMKALSPIIAPDIEACAIVHAGFAHTLLTGLRHVQASMEASIDNVVEAWLRGGDFDKELRVLTGDDGPSPREGHGVLVANPEEEIQRSLDNHDPANGVVDSAEALDVLLARGDTEEEYPEVDVPVTVIIQWLDTQLLKHCGAFGFDASAVPSQDRDTLVELVRNDTRTLEARVKLPEQIVISGPASMIEMSERNRPVNEILIEPGYKLRCTVIWDDILVVDAPIDSSYVTDESLDDVAKRIMPAVTVRGAQLVNPDGYYLDENGRFIVGTAQPGTTFEST